MTDRARAARAATGRRAATLSWLAAAVTFTLALGLVGWRMASGHDPSLGASAPAAPVARVVAPRRVIVKRIERRIIVTRVLPPRRPAIARAPAGTAAPASSAPAYAPAQRAAYVAPARPAYVPPVRAVAPAPAPHAVTRAS